MAKHWRRGYVNKYGTKVKGAWVKGRNPKAGCSFWLLGLIAFSTFAWMIS